MLLPRRGGGLAPSVAPGNPDVGLLLPYTPVHHLLLGLPGEPASAPLVMTSGNLGGEPIASDDADARVRLAPLVDGWLGHDRRIAVPCDDSVVRVVDGEVLPLRRSRGYAPLPVPLPFPVPPTLAVGGDLKNTCCLGSGRSAWLSGHIGDMDDLATLAAFDTAERHLEHLSGVVPDHLAADAHPRYRSRAWAVRHAAGRPVRTVQHHHAHVAAVMAEHGHAGPVVGVAFDGTGYGTDGAVWGGEVLVADYRGFRRFAHLRLRAAARRRRGGPPAVPDGAGPPARRRHPVGRRPAPGRGVPAGRARRAGPPARHRAGLRAHLQRRSAVRRGQLPAGRPAHGRLRGPGRDRAGEPRPRRPRPTARTRSRSTRATPLRADPAPVLRALVADLRAGVARRCRGVRGSTPPSSTSSSSWPGGPAPRTSLDTVALSGGVFGNALLLAGAAAALRADGFTVLRHRRVPPNDGGLALGQLVVSAALTDAALTEGGLTVCLAVPGRVVGVEERHDTLMAEVDFGGVRKDVCLQYLPDVGIGDYVIVHVGFAIQRLDERSALESLAEFERLGLMQEEFGDPFAAAARQMEEES